MGGFENIESKWQGCGMKPSFTIIGCGRVGCSLAGSLARAGYRPIGFFSRSKASAEKAMEIAGAGDVFSTAWAAAQRADMVFITTPDDMIQPVCRTIAKRSGFSERAVIFHCSGSQPSSILESARDFGCSVGSLHPLQSIAAPGGKENPFNGACFSVEGDPPAAALGSSIAADLQGSTVSIRTEAKTLYHAAAVAASNYLATLLAESCRLLGQAGMSERDAIRILMPLVRGTLANIEADGPGAALTGPVARGDLETVRAHLRAMAADMPESLALYRTLGRYTVDLAVKSGRLSESAGAAMRDLLSDVI